MESTFHNTYSSKLAFYKVVIHKMEDVKYLGIDHYISQEERFTNKRYYLLSHEISG